MERRCAAFSAVAGPVTILHISRTDDGTDQQAYCIGEDVPLATLHHLLRGIATRAADFGSGCRNGNPEPRQILKGRWGTDYSATAKAPDNVLNDSN